MKERALFGGMVRYEDPTTGEYLYRKRTPEDDVLPGDSGVFEGIVKEDSCWTFLIGDNARHPTKTGPHALDFGDMASEFEGVRVRVTIEVLDDETKAGGK